MSVLVSASCAARQPPRANPGPRPLCSFTPPAARFIDAGADASADATARRAGSAGASSGVGVRSLRPEQWAQLAVRGYDTESRRFPDGTQDCTGETISYREPTVEEGCTEAEPHSELLPARPMVEEDVVTSRGSGNLRLTWVAVKHYSNGESVGPLVAAEFLPTGEVAVRAIGTVRGFTRRARFRIEEAGGGRVLIVDGEHCTDNAQPSTCMRSVRLYVQRGDRFEPRNLVNDEGHCVGPARFDLSINETVRLDSGWDRHFNLARSLAYNSGGVVVRETVVVQDTDPSRPAVPARPFRRANEDRTIRLEDGNFVVDGLSLWLRARNERATLGALPDGGHAETHPAMGALPDGGR